MTFNVQKGPFKKSPYRVRGDILLPHPPPPNPARSLRSLTLSPPPRSKKSWPRQCWQITLGATKIYVISRGAHSLSIIIIWNGMLKARYYNFAPLAIWRKLLHTSNLCRKYASENGLFSGSRCQIFTALGEETPLPDPPPLGRFTPLTRRISETPETFLVTGLHTHAFKLFAMSAVAQCWTVVEHRIYP